MVLYRITVCKLIRSAVLPTMIPMLFDPANYQESKILVSHCCLYRFTWLNESVSNASVLPINKFLANNSRYIISTFSSSG